MFDLPSLPEIDYLLWLPASGLYVREAIPNRRQFSGTATTARALRLPYSAAKAAARNVIRATGQVVELRDVQPGAAQ